MPDQADGGGALQQEPDQLRRAAGGSAAVVAPPRAPAESSESKESKESQADAESTAVSKAVRAVSEEDAASSSVVSSGRDSPMDPGMLPRVIRLASDADEDLTSWYADTFSDELSEVKKSIKKASDQRRRSAAGAQADAASEGSETAESLLNSSVNNGLEEEGASSVSSSIATKLEIALMQANQDAEVAAREKELLEARMACLEELEELRMKLSTLELHELLEVAAREQQEISRAARTSPSRPGWDRDQDHSHCRRCTSAFTVTNRRHHCRRCGHIFDEACAPSRNVAPILEMGYLQPVRQCLDCLPLRGVGARAGAGAGARAAAGGRASPVSAGSGPRAGMSASLGGIGIGEGGGNDAYRISSNNKQPFSRAIDLVRRMESSCLKDPSPEKLLATLQAYVSAIEKIAKAEYLLDAHFRKEADATLLRAMHAFIEMKQVQLCLQDGAHKEAHAVISKVLPGST